MADPVPGVRLLEVLRQDAVGTVTSAVEIATGARVAVRRLHGHLCSDESARLVFAEEARRIATLEDPFLLRTLRSDARAAVPWIVTEPVDGPTLEDEIARGPWDAAGARRFVAGVLGAFGHLEARRQFHAAPVPSRIVRVGEAWRLLTFRDVRAEDEAARMKGRAAADPRFAAPETDAGEAAPTKARTLAAYAAGALWLFARTGEPPGSARLPPGDPDAAAIARLLDREPLRRVSGTAACLALVTGSGPPPAASGPPDLRPRRRRPT